MAEPARALAIDPGPGPEKSARTAYLWDLGGTVAPTLLGSLLLATEESALILPGSALILGGADRREAGPRSAFSLEPTLVLGPLGFWSPGLRASPSL